MVNEENIKEIQELKIPRRQRNHSIEEYHAVGNMRVRTKPKESDAIREARELGEDIVNFSKKYMAEKTKAQDYNKQRAAVMSINSEQKGKPLTFPNKEQQKVFYMGQKDVYTKPRFEPEMF